jgi:hypothetical protein
VWKPRSKKSVPAPKRGLACQITKQRTLRRGLTRKPLRPGAGRVEEAWAGREGAVELAVETAMAQDAATAAVYVKIPLDARLLRRWLACLHRIGFFPLFQRGRTLHQFAQKPGEKGPWMLEARQKTQVPPGRGDGCVEVWHRAVMLQLHKLLLIAQVALQYLFESRTL